ncbi:MAG: hypothetical protein ACOX6Y_02805 [Christensenellales bacterium]|jgi:hypothetical protein
MAMNSLAVVGCMSCVLSAAIMLLYSGKASKDEAARLRKLRQSPLYIDLYHKLMALSRFDIDQICIEASGVTVTSVCPAHTLLTFSFKQNGNSKRNDAMARLFAELIAIDFPLFARRSAYKFTRYQTHRKNGRPEAAYAFTMRRGYKDFLLAERCPAQLRIY